MNAWGKINDVPKGDFITLMSDTKTHFGKEHGWLAGMGDRLGRWAMIVEKDGKISYAESEKSIREVEVCRIDGNCRVSLLMSRTGLWCRRCYG